MPAVHGFSNPNTSIIPLIISNFAGEQTVAGKYTQEKEEASDHSHSLESSPLQFAEFIHVVQR